MPLLRCRLCVAPSLPGGLFAESALAALAKDVVPSAKSSHITTTRPFSPLHHQHPALQTTRCLSHDPPWHCEPRMRSAPVHGSPPPRKRPRSNNASDHSLRRNSSWPLTMEPTRTIMTPREDGYGVLIPRRSRRRRAGRISSSMGSSAPWVWASLHTHSSLIHREFGPLVVL
jgi:hypothetical protein